MAEAQIQKHNRELPILYLISFLATLHYALPVYIGSSFLETFLSKTSIGFIYAGASFLAIAVMVYMPALLNRFTNYFLFTTLLIVEMFALIGLALFESPYFIIPLFIVNQILFSILLLNLDLFFEGSDDNTHTGRLRGTVSTIINISLMVGPPIAGLLLVDGEYWRVFLASAITLIPVYFLAHTFLRPKKRITYVRVPFLKTLSHILKDANLRSVLVAQYALRFFYTWMIIYTPLYLHQQLHFSWDVIGVIFFIMMFPFVIFSLPLGKIADERLGEKEFLLAGFVILAIFTAGMSLTSSTNPAWWAFLLFGTRVGASFVGVMSETYFFKLVDGNNADLISFFRDMRPFAFLTAPVLASGALFFLDFRYIFFVLSALMVLALLFSLRLTDTA